jgi:hypothetical protein
MTPAEQRAELLAALAEVEAFRDGAERTISTIRRVLTATAVTIPPLAEPDRPEWEWSAEVARILRVDKRTMTQRCRRGVETGIARKVGGRWQVRLDLMAPGRVRPAR